MKTLKEMKEHGINYLAGYTDALKDFVILIMDPEVYDRRLSGVLLKYINNYTNDLLKEEGIENSAADR